MSFLKSLFGTQQPPLTGNVPAVPTSQNPSPQPSPSSDDTTHINQEMYKKSAELSEKNKTLSLLQKINEIILGSMTHLNETAQLFTSLLVNEAEFEIVGIYLLNKEQKILKSLALSETEKATKIAYITELLLTQVDNLIVQAVVSQKKQMAVSVANILVGKESLQQPEVQTALSKVKSVQIFPLIVRNETLGVMVVALSDTEQELSEYRRDLLHRLADTIGIALDNALLYAQVQVTNEKLRVLDKLKDEFVSVASHELRTPMTAIKSYLWMTLDGRGGEVSEKQHFYLQRAYNSVDRLIRLVNDMLNVSRIDSGRITIELKDIALNTLTQEVLDEVMPRAQELGLTLTMTTLLDMPKVIADSDKIKEVMFNLIGNSLKFTPRGGTITVSFIQKGDMIETMVKDTGTGIVEEDIAKLFHKFAMVEGSFASDKSIQGTGLGLYISKSIVELHGGKIWVTSEGRDKGTEFIFSLRVFHQGDVLPNPQEKVAEVQNPVGIIHTGV